jgi:hypothetical protein
MVSMRETPEAFVQNNPVAKSAYVVDSELERFDEVVSAALEGDPMFEQRKVVKVRYLGNFDSEHYADAFLNAARKVIDTPKLEK